MFEFPALLSAEVSTTVKLLDSAGLSQYVSDLLLSNNHKLSSAGS